MPREEFKREVERELTGKLIYFRVYKSQIPIIEGALEAAGLMLGSDKARGYCLEMICAGFLAGALYRRERAGGPGAIVVAVFSYATGAAARKFPG